MSTVFITGTRLKFVLSHSKSSDEVAEEGSILVSNEVLEDGRPALRLIEYAHIGASNGPSVFDQVPPVGKQDALYVSTTTERPCA
jgi:hypothetical protein